MTLRSLSMFLMAALLTAGSALTAQSLSLEECRSLYRHEMDVSMSDPLHPHRAALTAAKAALLSDAAVRAQAAVCVKNVSRSVFQCSIKARAFAEVLACRYSPDTAKDNTPDKKTDNPVQPGTDKQQDPGNPKQTNVDLVPVKVDGGSCQKAYLHLLGVYENSELLKKRPDRDKLLNYWRSKEASESFQKRCVSAFRPQDLGCLLGTKDADVIQGCLIVIPDKK